MMTIELPSPLYPKRTVTVSGKHVETSKRLLLCLTATDKEIVERGGYSISFLNPIAVALRELHFPESVVEVAPWAYSDKWIGQIDHEGHFDLPETAVIWMEGFERLYHIMPSLAFTMPTPLTFEISGN